MQACVIPSVRVRQSPTVKRALFDPATVRNCAPKKASQRSPYARAIIAAAPSSEPHLDIYFPIGSKTKGALQGPAFVRQYAPSIVRYYSARVGTYFGGLGLKEGCFSLCFLLLLQYKHLYQVSKFGSSSFSFTIYCLVYFKYMILFGK